ncbi:hypothetical protein [Mongoliibacter ruber]|uniref:Uncharacterized protein n=1 Tax=Mongoliibacter ruber TaxID=1750599 RepID=A0A2T0WSS1_9BACT|nr:hypothetical protein [Mongoliibacter ruber]PRY89725.1 hypothetical protein CLW00_102201 [Mongoliibacter ruber]
MLKFFVRFAILCLVINFSCVGKKIIPAPMAFQGECLQGLDFDNRADDFLIDSLQISSGLKERFDDKTLDMAIALNVIGDLEKYADGNLDRLEKLELKTNIYGKIAKMELELHSLMSAIDCEEEKGEQIASFLEKELRKKERNLTVAAIITGAVVSVGTGILLATSSLQGDNLEYIAIAGGLTEVFLGISILRLDKQITINHRRNVLRDVYESSDRPDYFPPSTWYYFNSGNNNKEGISLKEQLISRWETYNMSDASLAVLLSDGGNYSSEMLKGRSDMLDQLESQLGLINKDLLYFLNQIEQVN